MTTYGRACARFEFEKWRRSAHKKIMISRFPSGSREVLRRGEEEPSLLRSATAESVLMIFSTVRKCWPAGGEYQPERRQRFRAIDRSSSHGDGRSSPETCSKARLFPRSLLPNTAESGVWNCPFDYGQVGGKSVRSFARFEQFNLTGCQTHLQCQCCSHDMSFGCVREVSIPFPLVEVKSQKCHRRLTLAPPRRVLFGHLWLCL